MTIDMAQRFIVSGHVALAVCFALYLAWWIIFFRPADARPVGVVRTVGVACIVAAVIFGIAGVALCVVGIVHVPSAETGLKTWHIALGGMAAYIVLFVMTTVGFDRPPTTELVLIAGWATLEIACVHRLFSASELSAALALVLLVVVIVCTVVSLVCYVRYYHLAGWPALIDGAGPLVCGIVVAVAMACCMAG